MMIEFSMTLGARVKHLSTWGAGGRAGKLPRSVGCSNKCLGAAARAQAVSYHLTSFAAHDTIQEEFTKTQILIKAY